MRRPNGRKSARKTGRYSCVTRREKIETDSAVKKVETPLEALCWALLSSNEFLFLN